MTDAVLLASLGAVNVFVAAGACVNAGDEYGVSPLVLVIRKDMSLDRVGTLAATGANANARDQDQDGGTALMCASGLRRWKGVRNEVKVVFGHYRGVDHVDQVGEIVGRMVY